MGRAHAIAVLWLTCLAFAARSLRAEQHSAPSPSEAPQIAPAEKIIIDTDIGDDIDDAFAVALALRSPELKILGITTTFGDTEKRAKLLERLLGEVGRSDIPVDAAVPMPSNAVFTQAKYV